MGAELLEYFQIYLSRFSAGVFRAIAILFPLYCFFRLSNFKWLKKYQIRAVSKYKTFPLREVKLLFVTYFSFGFISVFLALIKKEFGFSNVYFEISDYGLFYTVLSFFILAFLDDAGFYWTHFLMHKPSFKFFFKSHMVHHRFINTTPFAAYAFDIGEAALTSFKFFLIVLLLPLHPLVLFIYLIFSILYNGLLHSGHDFFPSSWRENFILKWLNTPTHHSLHHKKHNCNFAFIFTFWDKFMKTEYYQLKEKP